MNLINEGGTRGRDERRGRVMEMERGRRAGIIVRFATKACAVWTDDATVGS